MFKLIRLTNVVTTSPNLLTDCLGNLRLASYEFFNINKVIYKRYTKRPDSKEPSKAEQIDATKMPGLVSPDSMHEEGVFTQHAKQQIEELKKRLDKPKVDNTEKKE